MKQFRISHISMLRFTSQFPLDAVIFLEEAVWLVAEMVLVRFMYFQNLYTYLVKLTKYNKNAICLSLCLFVFLFVVNFPELLLFNGFFVLVD